MRSLLFAAALFAYTVAGSKHALDSFDAPSAVPAPPSPPTAAPGGHWIDLFTPPYTGVPKVSMALSCISSEQCYLPGGTNTEGFDMFLFDGHVNGRFTALNMPDKAAMMMAIGMGGSKEDPKGVAGGLGIGNGLQYARNNITFDPSQVPTLFVETQDIRASANGLDIIAIDSKHVLASSNGGMNFTEKLISSPIGQCASGRYGAMVSASEWYVTLGSWPESNTLLKGEKQISQRVSMINGKRVSKKNMLSLEQNSTNCGYSAIIAKTTDGGNTFTNIFNLASGSDFYFNGIDCSPRGTYCVAVGEGFNANPAGHIFQATDGANFVEVKTLVSTQSGVYSLMAVRFKTETEVWVAGSKGDGLGSAAVFLRSTDGGATWVDESGTLPNIGDISDLSFTKDGEHGFATAITVYDDSTILRYGNKALPPAPPAPPTPAPLGMFTQSNCPTSACNTGCQNRSFQQGLCLHLEGGGSAKALCTKTHLVQTIYTESSACEGASQESAQPLLTCLNSTQGNFFENYCPGETPLPPTPAPPVTVAPPTPIPTMAPPVPPTPAPVTNSLTQKKCNSTGCTDSCTSHTFPTGQCVPAQNSMSAKVTCTTSTVTETIYESKDCTGMSRSQSAPTLTCDQAEGGGYLENICVIGLKALRSTAEAVFEPAFIGLKRTE